MKKQEIGAYIITFLLIFLAIVWIYPYIWLFISSFKPAEDIYTTFWPKSLTLDHYKFIFIMANRFERPFVRAFFNSLFAIINNGNFLSYNNICIGRLCNIEDKI